MTNYERTSATEWEWSRGNKQYSVRVFPQTERLVWAGWLDTREGPVFNPGVAQTIDDFLSNGAKTDANPPPELIDDLREHLQAMSTQNNTPSSGGLVQWLRSWLPSKRSR